MAIELTQSYKLATQLYDVSLKADVLVIGGGPAGAWTAITATQNGASVILVDKGYCGTSGATAPSGTGVWYIQPDKEKREEAMKSREALGGYLSERKWMKRVLDRTYANMNQLENWGYPFPIDEKGVAHKRSLQGPEYMRLMRRKLNKAKITILDHSPALELLYDSHGVAGAAGINEQTNQTWSVQASSIVIASGGCAFLSKALGCNVLTGDGYLLAAEAGADFSGMEFSNAYAITPKFSSITKTAFYNWASFTYEDGSIIEGAGSQRGRSVIAKKLQEGQKVFAQLVKAKDDLDLQKWMRIAQPNFFVQFDRMGINPFEDRFEVTLRLEGTVRGTGGIRIVDETCATSVPGLFAAGDAATRELICGGFTGGGSYNAAWAISSGYWSGEAAAKYASSFNRDKRDRALTRKQVIGINEHSSGKDFLDATEVTKRVQAEVTPFDKNLFRTEEILTPALLRLNTLWNETKTSLQENQGNLLRVRESAAMLATSRWMYTTALERKETRGMHKRLDYPVLDENQHYRLITSGLDEIKVKPTTILQNT
ncbi:FAD-binding protein [Neobacillus niacini]|uniref:FAD-dependent oxidoreductase n=1 Tax=Neobacillus niacini TaxID=86668 RepID=UPI0009EF125B|nr:FAD-binding protein [Neobacillus niacini]MEC1523608.1 FAD-binding protein [Neobacillus niacini]